MDNQVWLNFLEEFDKLQIFALCKDFDALSLEDKGCSFTSLVQDWSYGYRERFLHHCRSSSLSRSIIEQLRVPFLELPRYLLDSYRFQSESLRMWINFRFLPGQDRFLHEELQLPKSGCLF